jgi:selT/selW/selH-like putative selenoprotein
LTPGGNGIFDVVVDETKIFSKFEKGRFPENDEILALLGSD